MYVVGMLCVVLGDCNRRAQRARWAYYSVGLLVTTSQLYRRFAADIPAEQRVLLYIGAGSLTVQDTLRIVGVAMWLKLIESFVRDLT
jgi:hypothetical protein